MNTKVLEVGQMVYDIGLMGFGDVEFYPVEILEIIDDNKIKVIEHGLPDYWPENKIRVLNHWYLEPNTSKVFEKII